MRFAVVVSRLKPEVTLGLLKGALGHMEGNGLPIAREDIFEAPGAFEIPLLAQRLARSGRYGGIICLGCVVKGDTANFEYVSMGASMGIMQAQLETGVPISLGVLMTYNDEQANDRSRTDGEKAARNKGIEAAAACLETALALSRIEKSEAARA